MSFVHPGFLFALAAISIPIVIHLFNFRRFRKVYFSDIRFLRNVEMQTRSRDRLRHLLVLLARILAIICLVLAFAQPFIPTDTKNTATGLETVTIYVDNSFSMDAEGEQGSLLDEAKSKALEIAEAYANGSNLRLLTNDFEPQHQRGMSLAEFKSELSAIAASATVRKLSEVVVRSQTGDQQGQNTFLVSDLQRNISDVGDIHTDSLDRIYAVPVRGTPTENLFVDTCWFPSPVRMPGQPDLLMARIRNTGERTVENLSVRLMINGMQRGIGTIDLSGKSFEQVELAFTNTDVGLQFAEVQIEDYPITYDNRYLLSYNVARAVELLHIKGEDASSSVEGLYGDDPYVTYSGTGVSNVDYSGFAKHDMIVVDGLRKVSSGLVQELYRFCSNGGHVLLIPSEKVESDSWNELLLTLGAEVFGPLDTAFQKVEDVNLNSALMRNVFMEWRGRIDLPTVNRHFKTTGNARSGREPLLVLTNGAPFLSRYATEKGSVYVLTAPLNNAATNFHRHALFVPSLYNMALNSTGDVTSAETLGNDRLIPVKAATEKLDGLRMQAVGTGERFMPETVVRGDVKGVMVHGQVRHDGHHVLMNGPDTLQPVSFNYDRQESVLEYLSDAEFKELSENAGVTQIGLLSAKSGQLANTVRELQEGKPLWRHFLILALLFLAFEILLIRISHRS